MSITAKGTTNPSNGSGFAVGAATLMPPSPCSELFEGSSKTVSLMAFLVLKLRDKYSKPCSLRDLREIHDAAGKGGCGQAMLGRGEVGGFSFAVRIRMGPPFFSSRTISSRIGAQAARKQSCSLVSGFSLWGCRESEIRYRSTIA
jgi:hypothetical protein